MFIAERKEVGCKNLTSLLCSVIAVYLGTTEEKANMPQWSKFLAVAFILLRDAVEISLTVIRRRLGQGNKVFLEGVLPSFIHLEINSLVKGVTLLWLEFRADPHLCNRANLSYACSVQMAEKLIDCGLQLIW